MKTPKITLQDNLDGMSPDVSLVHQVCALARENKRKPIQEVRFLIQESPRFRAHLSAVLRGEKNG